MRRAIWRALARAGLYAWMTGKALGWLVLAGAIAAQTIWQGAREFGLWISG